MASQRINFTKAEIEQITPPTKGRLLVHDEGGKLSVRGLCLEVTPAGTRTFKLIKWSAGKPLRITLGRYGDITIEQARKMAITALGKIALGANPNTEKRVERAKSVTLDTVLTQYLETRTLKPLTVKDMKRAVHEVFPDWRSKPVNKITPAMVQRRHKEFGARSQARANLAMRYLRALFNFAQAQYKDDEGKPLLPINPVDTLSELKAWHKVDRRKTVIGPESLGAWVNAVLNLPNQGHRAYYLFVLMTGCRRSEALGLEWENVDLKARTVCFLDTKNGSDHTLPLPPFLCEELRKIQPKTEEGEKREIPATGPVFIDRSGKRISNLRTTQAAVTEASGVEYCLHDLRRTFATVAESLDVPGYALKRLLNHADAGDVTSGYLVINTERLRGPIEKVCDFILKSAGILPSATVIQLHRGEASSNE